MRGLLIGLIRIYQLTLARVIPPSCRFYPSCSHYAAEAIRRHGAWRGSALTAWRLLRCHSLNPGGFDPVPGTLKPESR
jgi:putative membrane protein insertion efficiency factor